MAFTVKETLAPSSVKPCLCRAAGPLYCPNALEVINTGNTRLELSIDGDATCNSTAGTLLLPGARTYCAVSLHVLQRLGVRPALVMQIPGSSCAFVGELCF
jgi:hypothetical protein